MEYKVRYLEMIQAVITRMASNSFLLKGWTVTLIVGILAFANLKQMEAIFIIVALIPAVVFWVLDGFFLYQEKLYRKLYEYATNLELENIDFSLNAYRFKDDISSFFRVIFSKTLLLFYVPILTVIVSALFGFEFFIK